MAFQSDFASFLSWESVFVADEPLGEGHLEGPRTVYYNQLPSVEDEEFPIGTILVKVARNGDNPTEWEIPAAVKRGGGYNPQGAAGWEWLELVLDEDQVPAILWRGEGPPSGSGYECQLGDGASAEDAITGDCNACHNGSWRNDYVQSGPLQFFQ